MTEKTQTQIMRMLQKVTQKFPQGEEPTVMTDIHIRANQETGDLMVFDDDDKELTRIVVDEWIENKDDDVVFYENVTKSLRNALMQPVSEDLVMGSMPNIIMPFCYVLENEVGEHIEELYIADNEETIIIGAPFMEGLDDELNEFMRHLMEE